MKPLRFEDRPEPVVIVKVAPANESWWAEPYTDRRQFDAKAAAEIPRMSLGKFGRGTMFDKFD